ncbi:MAG: DNA primase [Nitrospirales bacterium]|nr:MAG: DNA primase [Nitrospirales bacterium]
MGGKGIPPETLQHIRDRIDVIDVISRYVTLTKTGQNYKGLCPFHSEKSPSFSVSPSRQMFHCFGCGVGGDAITFLIKREGLGFMEAVQELAKLAGVPLVLDSRGGRDDQAASRRERYQHIHTVAAEWFHANLMNSERGKNARRYLERRGMSAETLETFCVGYAPAGWTGLLDKLEKTGVSRDDMFQSGLVIKKEERLHEGKSGGQGYDRFRDRIMFPISNHRGQVIAFGGRGLTDEQMPKYLNSPETAMFAKGQTLYGFHKTREAASRLNRLMLVEGYFDVLTLYQAGVQHVAAPLGTALTADHVHTIRRIVNTVLLFFDGDAAGIRAALRTLDLFLNTGLTVKVMELSPGDDPDTYIRSQGIDALTQLEAHAPTLLDFAIHASLKEHNGASIEERVRCVDEVLRILQKTNNPIEKEERIQLVAERLGIREQTLIDRYPMLRTKPGRSPERTSKAPVKPASSQRLPKGSPEERDVAVLALQGMLSAQHLQQLRIDMFRVPQYRRVMELVFEHVTAEGQIDMESVCADALQDDEFGPIVTQLTLRDSHFDDPVSHFQECVASLERQHIQHTLNELITQLRVAEQGHRAEEIQELIEQINDLRGKKAAL